MKWNKNVALEISFNFNVMGRCIAKKKKKMISIIYSTKKCQQRDYNEATSSCILN